MSEQAFHTEEYKGFTINIFPDYDYDTGMTDYVGALHCDARDLYIGAIRKDGREVRSPYSLKKMTIAAMLELLKTQYVFAGDYGSHSSVWLNNGIDEITGKELRDLARARAKVSGDKYADIIENDTVSELYDNRRDVLLLIPRDLYGNKGKDAKKKLAHSCWDYWQACIEGSVYGYTITDKDGDSAGEIGSCWGFVGSRIEKNDHYGGAIDAAREEIDSIDPKKHYREKYAADIKHKADAIKALSEKIKGIE